MQSICSAGNQKLMTPTCQVDQVQHAGSAAVRRLQPHSQDAVAAAAVLVHVGACCHTVAGCLLQYDLENQAACQAMPDLWVFKQHPASCMQGLAAAAHPQRSVYVVCSIHAAPCQPRNAAGACGAASCHDELLQL